MNGQSQRRLLTAVGHAIASGNPLAGAHIFALSFGVGLVSGVVLSYE